MGHRGYSGNHPRYSRSGDERYDAKEAYNKDLTASARLHYLENDRHDHESPMHKHNRAHRLRERAVKISERSGAERGDEYDYENPRVMNLVNKANTLDERSNNKAVKEFYKQAGYDVKNMDFSNATSGNANMTRHVRPKPKVKVDDERSGEERRKDIDEMIYERPDSPMNNNHFRPGDYSPEMRQRLIDKGFILKPNDVEFPHRRDFPTGGVVKPPKDLLPVHPNIKTERVEDLREPILPEPNLPRNPGRKNPKDRFNQLKDDRYGSPMNACAKSEGGSGCIKQMGGAWRVISNKTDKPWPAKYASKSKAEAALRGYHAG